MGCVGRHARSTLLTRPGAPRWCEVCHVWYQDFVLAFTNFYSDRAATHPRGLG